MRYTICHYCGRQMDRPRGDQKYCSAKCKQLAYRDRESDPDAPTVFENAEELSAQELFEQKVIREDKRRLMREYGRVNFEEIERDKAVTFGATSGNVTALGYNKEMSQREIRERVERERKANRQNGWVDPAIYNMLHQRAND